MPELSHDRCSELLRDYARGRLDATEEAAVERHLAGCPDCTTELTGLRALLTAGGEPLTEHERARLERGIAWQLGDVIPAARERSKLWTRAAAGLGAAALLAIVAVGIVRLGTGGGDNASGGGGGSRPELQHAAAPKAGEAAGSANSDALAAPPRPRFERRPVTLTSKKLSALGNSPQITAFKAYSTKDAVDLKDDYVSQLAALAPADQQEQVRSCAQRVYDSTSGYSLLAAYGADARLDGRRALVLGFAWTDKPAGSLDQYMLWVWPVANCTDPPLNYTSGQIGKH